MGNTRYIKSPDGKLAGSVPGPVKAPSPASEMAAKIAKVLAPRDTPKSTPEDAFSVYRAHISAETPEWARHAPFSTLNTEIGKDYVLATDYTREEDVRVTGSRSAPILIKRETADLFLRAEEVSRETPAPGLWTSVVRYPTYEQEDGSCPATRISRGDFGSSQENGIVTAKGEFTKNPSGFGEAFMRQLGEPGCPLYDGVEGYPEDWQIQTVTTRDHEVTGLHIHVVCEPVEQDASVLEDPDAAWDSRFD